jgi:hypothetical protein
MPSSTSSSSLTRATWLLLAGCLLVCVAVEGAARIGFSRASKIQHRFTTEYEQARRVGVDQHDRPAILFIGNSLLLEGVKFDTLHNALAREYDARRLVSERTAYLDWYYGLRRLFREGARPDIVVVAMTSRQWTEDEFRGDYSAHYLMSASDWREIADDLHWGATKKTNFLVANLSEFWGARGELRNFALQFLVPNIEPLINLFTSNPDARALTAEGVEPVAKARIARVRALTDAYQATLVLILPPTLSTKSSQRENSGWVGLMEAAAAEGITVVKPVPPNTFTLKDYRDAGFHLNDTGARRYTAMLLPELRAALARVAPGSSHLAAAR